VELRSLTVIERWAVARKHLAPWIDSGPEANIQRAWAEMNDGLQVVEYRHLEGAVGALAILNEAMGDVASAEWPDDARTYIARAAAALGGQ
jgi:hypothetical protein